MTTSFCADVVTRPQQGNGTFSDETKERGLSAPKCWSTGCSFFDYNRDGSLDLFVAHYLDFDPTEVAKPGDAGQCMWKGFPVFRGPMGLPPETMSGLGTATKADLAVRRPDGKTEPFPGLSSGTWVTMREGRWIAQARKLARGSP
jgi:hypothetical protein